MSRPTLTEDLARYVLPPAAFDGLSLAAVDAPALARFWAAVLGAPVTETGDGRFRIDPAAGRPDKEIVRVGPVRQAGTRQSRVHLDVRLPGADPGHIIAAGGRLLRGPGTDPWYVLADPEGNEFCAFPAVDDRPAGIFELVVKCSDAHGLARWWADVIGGKATDEGDAAAVVGAPEFPWDYMVFDPVPGIERVPGRMRWHLIARDPDPSALIGLGATVLAGPGPSRPWWLLADPGGNEFCVTCEQSATD